MIIFLRRYFRPDLDQEIDQCLRSAVKFLLGRGVATVKTQPAFVEFLESPHPVQTEPMKFWGDMGRAVVLERFLGKSPEPGGLEPGRPIREYDAHLEGIKIGGDGRALVRILAEGPQENMFDDMEPLAGHI